jgi:hypothetical protein
MRKRRQGTGWPMSVKYYAPRLPQSVALTASTTVFGASAFLLLFVSAYPTRPALEIGLGGHEIIAQLVSGNSTDGRRRLA